MIGIVNYGLGNLGSIQNMIKRVGGNSIILNNPSEIDSVNKIILPGVGSFDTGMRNLNAFGWIEPLFNKVIINNAPILGICLGMQLLTKSSEEGSLTGLGWIDAHTVKFKFYDNGHKIPNMGWNEAKLSKGSKLYSQLEENPRFYFVHSYYVKLNNPEDELFNTNYGIHYTSGFEYKNIYGVQFHPEKSHKFGMKLFKNFILEL